ncbi:hypothetical protein ACO03V_13015 [Microbacterium sp. HMH0099]|uniref:hypothetical protein n=1 Tax=Microbacterium TaxID=33882 RepID=UPI0036DC55E1
MTERNAPRPLAVLLCALAAAIFAFPILALPADTATAVRGGFILAGSMVFALGVVRMRVETRRPPEE